jgi:hypothetical protein
MRLRIVFMLEGRKFKKSRRDYLISGGLLEVKMQ